MLLFCLSGSCPWDEIHSNTFSFTENSQMYFCFGVKLTFCNSISKKKIILVSNGVWMYVCISSQNMSSKMIITDKNIILHLDIKFLADLKQTIYQDKSNSPQNWISERSSFSGLTPANSGLYAHTGTARAQCYLPSVAMSKDTVSLS